jgi:undecaprenyl-diphosphatase
VKELVQLLFAIPGPWVVAAVFVVSGLETAIVLGIFLPGEITIVLGGVLAAVRRAPLSAVLVASVAGPIAGDVIGYFVGKRYGQKLARQKLGARKWARAHEALTHDALWRIALARLLPFVRGVLPTTAGALRVRPIRFFVVDLPTAAVWGAGSALAGYVVGRDYETLLRWSERFSYALLALAVAAAAFWWWRRRKRGRGRS